MYFVENQDRVSWTIFPGDIILVSIRNLIHKQEAETNHTDQTSAPKLNTYNWYNTMEALVE